jgi:hypothetical protein
VNRALGCIYVRQTVGKLRKRGVVIFEKHAKNRNSRAPVDLNEGATAALVRAAAIQSDQITAAGSAWCDHNLVFTDSLGGPLDAQDVRRYFLKLLERAAVTQAVERARCDVEGARHAVVFGGVGVRESGCSHRLGELFAGSVRNTASLS